MFNFKNKIPVLFIISLIIIGISVGLYGGLTYLQDEINYFDLEPQGGLVERPETNGVVYHHTAVSDRPITSHHEFHLTRGWTMVGYNYHIRKDGTIEAGRPHNKQGAHAGGTANRQTIGVAFSGNMDERPPTEEQYESAIELHAWLENQYNKELEISGHKDWADTSCPGQYTDLNVIRERVEEFNKNEGEKQEEQNDNKVKGLIQNEKSYGYIINNRTYVPIREISENLGYDVKWDGQERIWEVK